MADNNLTDYLTDDIDSDSEYTQTSQIVTQKVSSDTENLRLDKFLVFCCPQFSRNQIIRFITTDCVKRVQDNEFMIKPDYRVKIDETFEITPPNAIPAEPEPENIPLNILYEDNDLLVVNKPAGMVVHPGAGNYTGTLVNALLYHCKDSLSGIGGVKRPGIVHRIDKDTSGILVIAKNDFTHIRLSEQFSAHTIERIYQAFVWNLVQQKEGIVTGNIGRSPINRQKMALVKTGGKPATTHYERLAVYHKGIASHIQCVLETGRTHQIRVHMSSIGHALIGDNIYGVIPKTAPAILKFFPRQALHAGFLGFVHPKSGKHLSFSVPLPDDLQQLKQTLENLGAS